MASSKGSSNSNKTAHVMNLLRKSNSPLDAPTDEAEASAAPAPAAPQAPIITALNADSEVSTQIRDALSDALAEEIGIDWECDTYDAGLNLNVWGAEKLSAYFGRLLTEHHGLSSQKGDSVLESVWAEKCAVYEAEKSELIVKQMTA